MEFKLSIFINKIKLCGCTLSENRISNNIAKYKAPAESKNMFTIAVSHHNYW